MWLLWSYTVWWHHQRFLCHPAWCFTQTVSLSLTAPYWSSSFFIVPDDTAMDKCAKTGWATRSLVFAVLYGRGVFFFFFFNSQRNTVLLFYTFIYINMQLHSGVSSLSLWYDSFLLAVKWRQTCFQMVGVNLNQFPAVEIRENRRRLSQILRI